MTEEEVRRGRASVRFQQRYGLVALCVMAAVAVATVVLVPFGVRLDYSGRWGTDGIPVWLGLLVPLVAQFVAYRSGFKKGNELMTHRDRKISNVLGFAFITVFLVGEFYVAVSGWVAAGIL